MEIKPAEKEYCGVVGASCRAFWRSVERGGSSWDSMVALYGALRGSREVPGHVLGVEGGILGVFGLLSGAPLVSLGRLLHAGGMNMV